MTRRYNKLLLNWNVKFAMDWIFNQHRFKIIKDKTDYEIERGIEYYMDLLFNNGQKLKDCLFFKFWDRYIELYYQEHEFTIIAWDR